MSKEKTKDVVGKMIAYLDQCFALYEQEDKRHITVCIGCTGGQHRSVYCAERLAAHLTEKYPHITVHLIHREQQWK
jgi:RNase adaptor protein for sRNA GlmZ degradation